ncbi:Jerky [Araneus ventricosus]|uniref:Jerky n=1 Tax=Araneus ventricosus TaxID=182803 RepID=A0A4Y2CE71_ARAVE|nr:Jerky [Araneus ventricosus]
MADSAKPSNKRKRVVLTITQKLDIIRRLERGENKQDLMRKFNIGSSTIYDIKLQKDKLMKFASSAETSKASDERRTLQQPQHEKLDNILYDWFLLKREEGIPISGPMLMEKARDFSEKTEYCKTMKTDISGEKKSADSESADEFSAFFEEFIKKNNINLDQIYNADETGVYFRCLPTSTLTGPNEISAHGFKKNKERLTVLTCANATGSHKIKLLVIGKSKNPRALTGIKHLPVAYKNQKNCWMDRDIFIYWFKCIFVPSVISELKAKGKPEDSKVILLIDNCRAHPSDTELRHGNISAMFLPPNVTSLIQPMDQGIIQNLKMIYRKNFMRRLINVEGTLTEFQSSFTIKDAIYGLASSWNAVKPRTLRRGWRKLLFVTHFCSDSSDDEEFEGFRCKKSELTDIMEALKNGCTKNLFLTQLEMPEIEIWMNVDKNIPVAETLTEEELIRKMIAPEEEINDISSESDDEKSSEEKISWGEAEKSLSTFLQFCEKNAHYSAQEVMELHLIKERFMKKRELSFKQTDIRNVFRRMCGATAEAQSKEK